MVIDQQFSQKPPATDLPKADLGAAPGPSKPSVLLLTVCSIAVPGSGHLILRRYTAGVLWILFSLAFYAGIVGFRAFAHPELYILIFVAGLVNCCVAAWNCAFHQHHFNRVARWILFIPVVLVSAVWVGFLNNQVAQASGIRVFSVPSESMVPFIRPGDYIVADMHYYKNHRSAQGDVVVVYRNQLKPFGGVHSLKRVIGVAGDRIEIVDGIVIKNDVRLEESYAGHEAGPPFEAWLRNMRPVVVPPSKLFLLGDNRDNSLDSRSPDVGFYDESEVQGKVIEVTHPFWVK
jgi:signal peptidase I